MTQELTIEKAGYAYDEAYKRGLRDGSEGGDYDDQDGDLAAKSGYAAGYAAGRQESLPNVGDRKRHQDLKMQEKEMSDRDSAMFSLTQVGKVVFGKDWEREAKSRFAGMDSSELYRQARLMGRYPERYLEGRRLAAARQRWFGEGTVERALAITVLEAAGEALCGENWPAARRYIIDMFYLDANGDTDRLTVSELGRLGLEMSSGRNFLAEFLHPAHKERAQFWYLLTNGPSTSGLNTGRIF